MTPPIITNARDTVLRRATRASAGPTPTPIHAASRLHFPRAPQASAAPSGSSTSMMSSTTTTSDMPFFPDPSTLVPPPNDDDGKQDKSNMARTIVEYVVLGVILFIILCLILRRIIRLKRTQQPLSQFFSLHDPRAHTHLSDDHSPSNNAGSRYPRTTGLPPAPPHTRYTFFPGPDLVPPPQSYAQYSAALASAYPPNRRTRAHDTDEGGRRLPSSAVAAGDGAGEVHTDHDGVLSDKDVLPAYDSFGGPPKYVELDYLPGAGYRPPQPASEATRTTPATTTTVSSVTTGTSTRSLASDTGSGSPPASPPPSDSRVPSSFGQMWRAVTGRNATHSRGPSSAARAAALEPGDENESAIELRTSRTADVLPPGDGEDESDPLNSHTDSRNGAGR